MYIRPADSSSANALAAGGVIFEALRYLLAEHSLFMGLANKVPGTHTILQASSERVAKIRK